MSFLYAAASLRKSRSLSKVVASSSSNGAAAVVMMRLRSFSSTEPPVLASSAKPVATTTSSSSGASSTSSGASFFQRIGSFLVGAGLMGVVSQYFIYQELLTGNLRMIEHQQDLDQRLRLLEKLATTKK